MDVTPQVINEVEFHQKMRGYDPDEVDDFLERIAVAVEQFQERIRLAEQRAMTAERRAAEIEQRAQTSAPAEPAASTIDDETETIRRTLVLAQRTADAAIKEAEEEAARTLQEAHDQVERLHAEAQEQARKLVVDAETEARQQSEETRQRLVSEIATLEETRDSLRADQGILERHLDEQRLRLRSSIGELQRLLDDPARLRVASAPEISGATMPELFEPTLIDEPDDEDDEPLPAAIGNDATETESDAETVIDLDASPAPFDVEAEESRPITGGVTYSPPDDTADNTFSGSSATADPGTTPEEEDAWVRFMQTDLGGPPTMAVPELEDDDAYLSELRKAMLSDTSAGSLDAGEHRARTRFGRRR